MWIPVAPCGAPCRLPTMRSVQVGSQRFPYHAVPGGKMRNGASTEWYRALEVRAARHETTLVHEMEQAACDHSCRLQLAESVLAALAPARTATVMPDGFQFFHELETHVAAEDAGSAPQEQDAVWHFYRRLADQVKREAKAAAAAEVEAAAAVAAQVWPLHPRSVANTQRLSDVFTWRPARDRDPLRAHARAEALRRANVPTHERGEVFVFTIRSLHKALADWDASARRRRRGPEAQVPADFWRRFCYFDTAPVHCSSWSGHHFVGGAGPLGAAEPEEELRLLQWPTSDPVAQQLLNHPDTKGFILEDLGMSASVGLFSAVLADVVVRDGIAVSELDTLADACSCISAFAAALRVLNPGARHVHASEWLRDADGTVCRSGVRRAGILERANAGLNVVHDAASAEAANGPAARVFAAGVPCSHFSTGNPSATEEGRAATVQLLNAALDYVRRLLREGSPPWVLVIENAPTLGPSGRCASWGTAIIGLLQQLGAYKLRVGIASPDIHSGSCGSRPRFVVIGTLLPHLRR